MYDSSFPSDTCISVVYVVSCERKKSSLKYYTFNASIKTRMEDSPCSALAWLRAHHIWSSVRCSETKMSHQRRVSSWKKQESQVSEPHLLSTPADTFVLNVCRHYSLSVWSGSYTSWLEFCDHPGKMAPSSDHSLSPGRTSGPASRRS